MTTQERVYAIGKQLFELTQGEQPSIFNRDFWQGKLMDFVMRDPSFKVDMFRFVDVLPVLTSTSAISQHIKEYLLLPHPQLPMVLSLAIRAAAGGIGSSLAAKAMRKNVIDMAQRFIVGTSAQEATPVLKALHEECMGFTADLLGEATLNTQEALDYRDRYLDLIETLAVQTEKWDHQPVLQRNHLGPIPLNNVSIKLTAMEPMLSSVDRAGSVKRLVERLKPLFYKAQERNVFLNIDLEQWDMHPITYDVFEALALDDRLRSWPHLGIVVQAYLRDSEQDVERLLALAKKRGTPITVRLVKGAYWDYETVYARQMGFRCPVFEGKSDTDRQYEHLSRLLLDNCDWLQPAFGSHNIRSLAQAFAYAESKNIPHNAYEVQMLYGMAEPERKAIVRMQKRLRLYAPVGELLPGMAYLVRRLLENTSNTGFLRLSHQEKINVDELLKPPSTSEKAPMPTPEFRNASFSDFTQDSVQQGFSHAVKTVFAQTAPTVPVVVAGKTWRELPTFTRVSPNDVSHTVAHVCMGNTELARQSVEHAFKTYPAWRDTPLEKRAQYLGKLADRLEQDRYRLAALQVLEVAKPFAEADADIAEGIDFCRYYEQQALSELASRQQGSLPGENNMLVYEGRGPTVVIAPWNFPLAILCGMTVAAAVAGNTVIMKPAEQSSLVAYALYEHMCAVGLGDVIQFLPGEGESIGPVLVEHPLVAQVAFTGSMAVGHQIVKQAAQVVKGQVQMKRVVCEMGGKNAIIVDDDADIDEAVMGVVKSAFGFAGQKCSACSRVIVVGDAYQTFIPRLLGAASDVYMAQAQDPGCMLPPVVDEEAQRRLMGVIEENKQRAKVLYVGQPKTGGYFVPPALFEVDSVHHPLMQQEFFGPIVAVLRVKTFEEALEAANASMFALTGAVYSRSPLHLQQARSQFRVGNLYLNRGSTGALVYRQPFGGFKMSGIGTKAGGPGYLLQFAEPRCVTENTMRRGFTD